MAAKTARLSELRLAKRAVSCANAAYAVSSRLGLSCEGCHKRAFFWTKPTGMATPRERRKLRREFRRKGYRAVYHEVNGYPPGKRELAHEWLRERERGSERREQWMIFALIVVGIVAVITAYFAAAQLKWL